MKSYWMQVIDGQAVLALRDIDVPVPGVNQVVVRVRAASLNRGEFILGHGLHGKGGAAKAVGMEASGEVVKWGDGVSGVSTGDAVMGRCAGAFAEYALMETREVLAKPPALSWHEAASIPLAFLVVYDMLGMQGRLKANEWVLIAGVSSGVGVAALQLAKAMGAKVIGTSGSQGKIDRLKDSGLDAGLCTRGADFYEDVMKITDRQGVNLVVNAVGGSVFAECVRCMAFEARLATVGYVDGVLHGDMDIEALHAKRLTLFGVSNKMRSADQKAQALPGFRANVLPLFDAGKVKPVIDQIYPFEQLAQAKLHMEANLHVGKIVLTGSTSS